MCCLFSSTITLGKTGAFNKIHVHVNTCKHLRLISKQTWLGVINHFGSLWDLEVKLWHCEMTPETITCTHGETMRVGTSLYMYWCFMSLQQLRNLLNCRWMTFHRMEVVELLSVPEGFFLGGRGHALWISALKISLLCKFILYSFSTWLECF